MLVLVTFYLEFVQISFSSVENAELLPIGKELLTRLALRSLRIMSNYILIYLPFWFCGRDLSSDCYFYQKI